MINIEAHLMAIKIMILGDGQYVSEYGNAYDCLICGDSIEHGQIRVRVRYLGIDGDAHDDCAEAEAHNEIAK